MAVMVTVVRCVRSILAHTPGACVCLALVASCTRSQAPDVPSLRVLFGSSPERNVNYDGMADYFSRTSPALAVALVGTAGSQTVVSRIDAGEGEIGVAQADVAYAALRQGTEDLPKPHHNLRALAVLESNTLLVIARRERNIRDIAALRGKRIIVARKGGASELFTRIVLDAYGLRYSDMETEFAPFEDIASRFVNGDMDAMIVTVGTGSRLRTPIAAMDSAAFETVPIRGEAVQRLRREYPFSRPVTISVAEAPWLAAPLDTVGVESLLVCRRNLDEDIAYAFIRGFFAWREARRRPLNRETAAAAPIPLHPGAARYYREREILR